VASTAQATVDAGTQQQHKPAPDKQQPKHTALGAKQVVAQDEQHLLEQQQHNEQPAATAVPQQQPPPQQQRQPLDAELCPLAPPSQPCSRPQSHQASRRCSTAQGRRPSTAQQVRVCVLGAFWHAGNVG
jgi:hypothetical protein